MPMISRETAEHYVWGQGCDGWRLLARDELSVIHERMPAGTAESRHTHLRARQFFLVLAGELVMEVEGRRHTLRCYQGIEVAPGAAHQARNESDRAAEFLVISQPSTRADRVSAEPASA